MREDFVDPSFEQFDFPLLLLQECFHLTP
jgi:hypothetical protein